MLKKALDGRAGSAQARFEHLWPVVAATLLLLFFSIGELFRFFFAALALAGLVVLIRRRAWPTDQGFLWFSAAFACLWLPMLLSLPDSESPAVSVIATARYLMYLLAAYLWIEAHGRHPGSRALLGGAFAVLLLWTADAVFQLVTGVNFFGQEAFGGQRITGMMGTRITLVLAIMSPVFFHAVVRFGSRKRPLALLLFPYLLVILYGGTRVAWMLLLLSMFAYALVLWAMGLRKALRWGVLSVAVIAVIASLAVAQTDWLKERIVRLDGLFSGDYAQMNVAVSDRLPHWIGAARMYQENPINGIGVKSYKYSYADYAPEDERFRGQPHLFALEVAAETGTIGLIGFALFQLLIAGMTLRLLRHQAYDAATWGIALLLAAFPLSATLSLYSHFMSSFVFYLAMVFFALASPSQPRDSERRAPLAGH
ncbi:Lipid A core - O-antigen ligase [Thiorhodovibrio winogradskyi]|uniref:Lipid A core - O-antigen ligase n=1 Tax=Thiorhodovibrio winogradskyi TaxID=77007 RepID=A0ABZ0SFG5_9GAMM|nr:O-antigen ligase family protein [Thiorhodovibrio winogradskyi]